MESSSYADWLTEPLCVAIEEAAPVVSAGADEADAARALPPSTVQALSGAGLFTMLLPADVGGTPHRPEAALAALSSIAFHDGAAGWCSMISTSTCLLAGFLDTEVARSTFGSATAVGGVFAPNGVGTPTDDGLTVSGRWQWGSGLAHCDWVVAGVTYDGDKRVTVVAPRSDVKAHDTWQTVGMRGTGSVDFEMNDVFVPSERMIPQLGATPKSSDSRVLLPNFSILGAGVAAVALGIAERAWSETAHLANERAPQFSQRLLAEQSSVQSVIARSRARLDSCGGELFRSVEAAHHIVEQGEKVPLAARVRIRGAAALVVEESAAIGTEMFRLSGGAAVYDTSVLGRCLRNLSVIPQHIMVAPRLFETLGRHHLGLDFESSMI